MTKFIFPTITSSTTNGQWPPVALGLEFPTPRQLPLPLQEPSALLERILSFVCDPDLSSLAEPVSCGSSLGLAALALSPSWDVTTLLSGQHC